MRVGFIGVGNMGGPMCMNVVRAGHEVVVTDIRRDAAAPLLEAGAKWVDTAKEAAAGAEVVFMSLPMPADVESVMTKPDGVLAGVASGAAVVDLSTNSPAVVRRLAEVCKEKGVGFLDAPVSGGVVGARRGTLAVMVGGDAALFEHCKPLLDAIGENVFHAGDVGAGNVAKLVNNMLAFINMMGVCEGLVLGAKAGIDPMVLKDIVAAGSGNSMVWRGGSRAILRDRLAPSFTMSLAAKDIGLAAAMAEEFGATIPMGLRAKELIERYRDNGYAGEDVLAAVKEYEKFADRVVRGAWPAEEEKG
ncbi:MAG: NAD(P)-dependent oxidoreductase [Acidimicrobiales bacterium]